MDIITYALCKKIAEAAVSGIKNLTVRGTDLIIETVDGNTVTMTFPTPEDGKDGINGQDGLSIIEVKIDTNNHLICTLSDNSTIDAGELPSGSGNISDLDYATNDDIDKMFENLEPLRPEVVDYATNSDIDKLFE